MKRLSLVSRFRRLAAVALLLAALPAGAAAQTAEQRAAVVDVIQGQLNAFRRDDGAGAYGFAAPNIRTLFPSVDIFMDMVRGGYGFLIDPAGAEFLDIRADGAALYQAVRVIGRDGRRRIAIYQMERQADGSWKIAGVYITEDPQAAV